MSTEQIGFYEIPNAPGDRQKLLQGLENCRAAQIRIISEQTFIADTIKELAKEFDIKGADLRKLVTDRAKGTYGNTVQKADIYQDLYESLYPNSKADAAADVADAQDAAPAKTAADLEQSDEQLDALFAEGKVAETV
ncbi:transcriptional regulator [Erwinia phage vB_EamM-Bue1]|uniref:Uncharacterized protein n=1 Tax=Erwinia phage vB_EamM-Bue1 TaxID=2099338 RepID=A0A2P1JU49_9CAUD|nr:transcriptional regulator [Erwinia phage vB_EamM-Bue1]AVO22880.1 hypothetical protein [Erwinia phage vB_EamM-Bue1]